MNLLGKKEVLTSTVKTAHQSRQREDRDFHHRLFIASSRAEEAIYASVNVACVDWAPPSKWRLWSYQGSPVGPA